jgi:hypothetical protein
MKSVCLLSLPLLLAACVTPPSTETRIESCRKITDRNFRDLCITDALREAEIQRQIEHMSDQKTADPDREKQP